LYTASVFVLVIFVLKFTYFSVVIVTLGEVVLADYYMNISCTV